MKINVFRSALVTTFALALSACAGTGNSSGQSAVNSMCVMNPKDPVDNSCTTMFDGQTVGFCCDNCKEKFEGMTASEKKAKLGAMPMK